jgi:hypothetical protein
MKKYQLIDGGKYTRSEEPQRRILDLGRTAKWRKAMWKNIKDMDPLTTVMLFGMV